jgi:Flp pilus assembly protein TadG
MTATNQSLRKYPTRQRFCRDGAAILECAIALPVMLLALFALLDLGLAATRYNALAEAARQIARQAILHGSLAPAEVGGWGPTQFVGTAADSSDIVQTIHGRLPTMPEHLVNVQVTWPDHDNSARDRVQVQVTYQHHPLVPGLTAWGSIDLQSVATMRIVN